MKFLPKDSLLTEGLILNLIEAEGQAPGYAWDVQLITKGLSANGFYYGEAPLRAAIPKFEGAKAIARTDDEHSFNMGAHVKNIVGWFEKVEYREGSRAGLYARLHVMQTAGWLADMLTEAHAHKKKDLMGLSIVARGEASPKRHMGQEILNVESISDVYSVDPVVRPAAGGRFISLVEAYQDQVKEELKMFEELIKLIEAKRPDLLEGKDQENLTEAEVKDMLAQAMATPKEPDKLPVDNKSNGDNQAMQTQLTEAEKRLAGLEHSLKLATCQASLSSLVAASKLPELAQGRLKKMFEGKLFAEAELTAAIDAEREYLAKLAGDGQVRGAGAVNVEMVLAEQDRLVASLDGFFFQRDQEVKGQKIPAFRSFKEAYLRITGDERFTGRLSEAKNLHLFAESGLKSDSWTAVLGDSITRRMVAEYNLPQLQTWRELVSDIVAVSDFRTQRRPRWGTYADLASVAELGNYLEVTSPGDEEATYSISKRGGLETISMEMIANDDVGAIRRIPVKMARAAARTLFKAIYLTILENNATYLDNNALFYNRSGDDDGHDNLIGDVALSQAGLTTGRQRLLAAKSSKGGHDRLGLVPKFLLVPPGLEETAWDLTKAGLKLPATGTTGWSSDFPSLHQGLTYQRVDYFTDANDWYLVADPADIPTFEVGFFQGQEDPALFVQDAPEAGSMFTADKITYKIRHIWGVCVLDYRGFAKAIVS